MNRLEDIPIMCVGKVLETRGDLVNFLWHMDYVDTKVQEYFNSGKCLRAASIYDYKDIADYYELDLNSLHKNIIRMYEKRVENERKFYERPPLEW